MRRAAGSAQGAGGEFRPLGLIAAVAAVMLLVNLSIRGYSQAVSLPRYCDRIERTVGELQHILTQSQPAPEGQRREYLIAAKLLFLEPQQAGEPVEAYLARIRSGLNDRCR